MVPVLYIHLNTPEEAYEVLLSSNCRRVKTNEQLARGVAMYVNLENDKAINAQEHAREHRVEVPVVQRAIREIVARKLDMPSVQVDQCVEVVKTLEDLEQQGSASKLRAFRELLGESINRAYNGIVQPDDDYPDMAPYFDEDLLKRGFGGRTDIISALCETTNQAIKEWSTTDLLLFKRALPSILEKIEQENLQNRQAA
jgi:hypothetical protein